MDAATTAETTGWWTRSVADGDGHHGTLTGGVVRAACGASFQPEPHPFSGKLIAQPRPADHAHACGACLRKLSRTR